VTLTFLYWLLMLFWVLTGIWWGSTCDPINRGRFGGWGLLLFLMLLVLGLKIFGWPIRGG